MPDTKPFVPQMPVTYSQNIGGVNMGKIENMLQLFEFADGYNFDLSPDFAFRKRDGTEARIFTDALQIMGMARWNAPTCAKTLMIVADDGNLYERDGDALKIVGFYTDVTR